MAHNGNNPINECEKSFRNYFKDIQKYNPLSRKEELSLWRQYKNNHDIEARNKLVAANLRFVASIAKCYQGKGLSYPDLIAEGNMGLMKAIDKFDYRKGYKTISYSVYWIRQTILDALTNNNKIQTDELPSQVEDVNHIPSQNDYDAADERVCDSLTDDNIADRIDSKEIEATIDMFMNTLNERESFIISRYYGINGCETLTLEDIGEELGLTKERVRQIKEKALRKMRSDALGLIAENRVSF